MVQWCVSAYSMSNLNICEFTINVERYIQLASRQHIFQGRTYLLQHDNAKPNSAHFTIAWLHSKKPWVLDWSCCSPDLCLIKNVWNISAKYNNRDPEVVSNSWDIGRVVFLPKTNI